MKEIGRPEYPDEQYATWLEAMRPFLENANSIRYALERAGLTQHKNIVYRKYRLNDWFRDKIDAYRQRPGELVNDIFSILLLAISDKTKRGVALTSEEIKIITFYAEKSRSAQPWFVNRQETAVVKPIDEIVDEIDGEEKDTINDVASEAQKQVVAINPPVQNQEQTGQASTIPAEPNAAPVQN